MSSLTYYCSKASLVFFSAEPQTCKALPWKINRKLWGEAKDKKWPPSVSNTTTGKLAIFEALSLLPTIVLMIKTTLLLTLFTVKNRNTLPEKKNRSHGVWKSQKKSHSTLRAKRATFTFWVDKRLLKMPKMVHFGEFLKTWSLRSNSVTRQVSYNRTKIGGKWQN